MNHNKLGNLEKISLREAWEDEAMSSGPTGADAHGQQTKWQGQAVGEITV